MAFTKRSQKSEAPGFSAPVRLEPGAELGTKYKRGEIVVLDRRDLDRVTAERLVQRQVAAVINVSTSITGRYPTLGPQVLVDANIPLIDFVGPEIMQTVSTGDVLRIDNQRVYRGEEMIATGALMDRAYVKRLLDEAKAGLSIQLQNLSANAAEQMRREQELFLDGLGIPQLKTKFASKHVLVVDKRYDYAEDLKELSRFIRRYKPIVIAAGEAIYAVEAAGYRTDIWVAKPEELEVKPLKKAKEVVVVALDHRDGHEILERAGKQAQFIRPAASTADLAMLIAANNGARVVVLAGSHTSLVEYLDRPAQEMAGAFLSRMRMAGSLVDAKAIAALNPKTATVLPAVGVLVIGVLSVGAALLTTATGASWFENMQNLIQGWLG